jgi:homoserine O-acetyltransferase
MIRKVWAHLAAALLLLGIGGAAVADDSETIRPSAGDFVLRGFRFDSGEILPELNLHYTTLGTRRADGSGRTLNAVLLLHGTGGSGAQFLQKQFAGLFGPGQLLDASSYFIVLPDGIGHGASSKPSGGLRGRFPRYGYGDMVRAQYRLVTEGLGVTHLRLVLGTSMGGMHTWVWGETHPDFADALLPLASLPAPIAGRNRMWRKMSIDLIRGDPEWKNGDYGAQPRGLRAALSIMLLISGSPLQWMEQAPTAAAADGVVDAYMASRLASTDANDLLFALEASRDYDPVPKLGAIRAPLVAVNFADDAINPPELGLLESGVGKVKDGKAVLVPLSEKTKGHQTHTWPEQWKEHLEALLARSGNPTATK